MIQLLPALTLLDEAGISPEIPILVSDAVARMPFFKSVMETGAFRHRHWIVADERYIRCEQVLVPRTEWPTRKMLDQVLDWLEIPQPEPSASSRIFIDRSTRTFSNTEQINSILLDFGFEFIRPEQLSFEEQIQHVARAGVVAGVSGAGLANVIYRRDCPTVLLEITPTGNPEVYYSRLARTCGYSYGLLVDGEFEHGDRYDNFHLDPELLTDFLETHL
jgi:capsular polysaccharide biosynthesis protein